MCMSAIFFKQNALENAKFSRLFSFISEKALRVDSNPRATFAVLLRALGSGDNHSATAAVAGYGCPHRGDVQPNANLDVNFTFSSLLFFFSDFVLRLLRAAFASSNIRIVTFKKQFFSKDLVQEL